MKQPEERPILEIRNLCKSYKMEHGYVQALDDINFHVCRGESVAIMGPSGSGKSTLLHLLGCLDGPSQGHYFLNGQDVSTLNDKQLALIRASNIGFVFQSFNLIPQFNVFENVEVPFLYHQHLSLSSAKINKGSIAKARAIATRCVSPPDNWEGK